MGEKNLFEKSFKDIKKTKTPKKVIFIFCNEFDQPLSFPIGVGILSSVLKNEGHITKGIYVIVNEDNKIDLKDISEQVKEFNPDLIAYSCSSPLFESIKVIAKHLRENFSIPSICGGVHATLYPKEVLSEEGIDYICVGEGENALKKFVEEMNLEEELDVPGIWRLNKFGKLIKNKIFPLQNLDNVPTIDYEIFGKPFIDNLVEKNNGWQRYIISRGCPYSCSYCYNKMIRKTYAEEIGCSISELGYLRSKSLDLVIEEILEMVKKYDITVINFMDDLFCLNKKNALEFCKKFKEKVPKEVGYSIQTHLSFMDEEIIQELKDSRCLRVVVGIESANERILEIFNRKTSLNMMNEKISLLVKAKFPSGIWTLNILGNPTEVQEEALDTLAFNARHLVDVCKFQFMAPYQDSEIYRFCKERGLLEKNYGTQKISDRFSINVKHNPREKAFLEKFFDIGHWYMNIFAPLDLEGYYLPLIKEVEKIGIGEWEEKKEEYLKRDRVLEELLSNLKKTHYSFMFKGKIAGKAIGLKKFND